MTPTARQVVATATALVFLAGCATQVRPLAPHELGTVKKGARLLVETTEGLSLVLKETEVDSTRLLGIDESGERRQVPLDTIRSVRVQTKDATLLYALVPTVAVAIWLVVGASTAPEPPPSESCPFVFAHDGRELVFEAEPYGGAIAPALQRTEWTPLSHLREVDGEYRIRIANELDETQHTDEARLVVVDHPAGTRVAADPFGRLHVFEEPAPPRSAMTHSGRDVTALLQGIDRQVWLASYGEMDDATRATLRDPLVLEFAKPPHAGTARLLVSGATSPWGAEVARDLLALRGRGLTEWYEELDARGPALLALLGWYAREGLYMVPIEVETAKGWQARGTLFGSGPFAYKTTAYALDVSDVTGEVLRVRLPVPVGFWALNAVRVDYAEQPQVQVREVQTTTVQDARGRDVQRLLAATDGEALVMAERHDYADLSYPAPPLPADGERTVFLKISGHYDVHVPAEGEPQETLFRRVLSEPGFTLQFAFERHIERVARSAALTARGDSR